jgi:hypothetical protein
MPEKFRFCRSLSRWLGAMITPLQKREIGHEFSLADFDGRCVPGHLG